MVSEAEGGSPGLTAGFARRLPRLGIRVKRETAYASPLRTKHKHGQPANGTTTDSSTPAAVLGVTPDDGVGRKSTVS